MSFDNLTNREAWLIGVIIHHWMPKRSKCSVKCASCNFPGWAMANLQGLIG